MNGYAPLAAICIWVAHAMPWYAPHPDTLCCHLPKQRVCAPMSHVMWVAAELCCLLRCCRPCCQIAVKLHRVPPAPGGAGAWPQAQAPAVWLAVRCNYAINVMLAYQADASDW